MLVPVTDPSLVPVLERIVMAGVALTTRALNEAGTGLDLTFPQWRVLLVLGDDEAGATVSEVASRVGVTVPATSRQLRRLERRGLVAISRDERDRRATRARLTETGASVRETILAHRRDRITRSTSLIRTNDATRRELVRIADALDAYR